MQSRQHGSLTNIKIKIDIPSAQIKSGIILAALNVKGKSTIFETNITRNHTEIMLESFGANIDISKKNEFNYEVKNTFGEQHTYIFKTKENENYIKQS